MWKPIRAFALIVTVSMTGLMAINPGQATLLRGYVNHDQAGETQQASPDNQQGNTLEAQIQTDSFPASYSGTWRVDTVVSDSTVNDVSAGQKMLSSVEFKRQADGRVTARWNQPGWTETQASITTFNQAESMLDRTNYYYGDKMQGAWGARSRDKFTQVSENQIMAQSYVDQYIDGHYLGRYRTKSVLSRMPSTDVAFAGQ